MTASVPQTSAQTPDLASPLISKTVFALGVCVFLLSDDPAAAQNRATVVDTDRVIEEPLSQTQPVIGRLVTRQSGAMAARVAGAVTLMRTDVGARVRAGDILAELDTGRFEATVALRRAELAEAEAAVQTARATQTLAAQELQRLERLRRSAAFSPARYDDQRQEVARTKGAAEQAGARRARARAALRLAEIDLGHSRVRAAFDGVVSVRHVSAGAFVSAGTKVVTLVDDGEMEVEADIPSNIVTGLSPNRLVDLIVQGQWRTTGLVRAVVPDENPLTRTRLVRITPDFAPVTPAGLAVNQSVTVMVPVGAVRDVVSVHKDAVLEKTGGRSVFLVVDKAVQPRTVTLGAAVGPRLEVLSGLKPGDQVVVTGNERLRPGQQIRVRNARGPEPGGG